ncbi:ABC transporter substrate-binding protein [Paenibacillus antarcticus]|uniref:Sugar ABC transporter substrate-binding protein n=1 Tax=Paenibacillus antarcticus TaxID=253703 RepID=A0A168NFY7_9BACL|nr:extracellular solute-binding protein [Paenibacillus antarcticus]OAB45756.1 sugar ABC transporter substrate-binding protein [Paenibacillus antarcticus]
MKKVNMLLLTAITVLSMTLAGCSGAKNEPTADQGEKKEKVKVRIAYWNKEESVKTLLDLVKEKLPNIEVEYQFIDNKQYQNIIETQLTAGAGPDIISTNPYTASRYAKLGYIKDISSLADRYNDGGKNVYSVDGKLYALPGISWFEGMFYNKEIFDKLNLKPPTTFEEELALHETLKKNGVKPQAMGAKSWEPMMKSSMAFVMNDFLAKPENKDFDVQYAEGKTKLDGNWNTALEQWSELIKKEYLTEDMLGIDYDQALDEFATGKAAMWQSGPWAVETIQKKNANLKFDMFPFYGTEPGAGWLIGGPGVGFAANSNSKHQEEVMQVLDLISTPEGQQAFWNDNKGGSSYLKGVEFEMPEQFASVSETLKAGNVYAPWNNWGNASNVIEDYGKYFQYVLSGEMTVTEALQAIDKKTAELIKAKAE